MERKESLEHDILLRVTLYISLMSIAATFTNLPVGLYKSAVVTIIASIIYLFLYLILKNPKYTFLKKAHIIYSFFIYVSILWFFNDGSKGSTIILFTLCFTVSAFIIQIKKQLFFTIGSILVIMFLLLVEYNFPELIIVKYNTVLDRYLDIGFTIVITFILLKQLIGVIKISYNNERKKVEHKNIELLKSKTELEESKIFFNKLAENIPGLSFQYKKESTGATSFNYISSAVFNIYEVTPEMVYKNQYTLFKM